MSKKYKEILCSEQFEDLEIVYSHIDHIDVYTGDDSFNETACAKISSKDNSLVIETNNSVRSGMVSRARGEVCAKIFLTREKRIGIPAFERDKILLISHHKGSVYISLRNAGDL